VASAMRAAVAALRMPPINQKKVGAEPKQVKAYRSGMMLEAAWSDSKKKLKTPEASAVGAIAAAMAIPYMSEKAAANLAEAHGIVCHLTSLVLVDEAGAKQDGIPAQRKVPLMTPRTASMRLMAASANSMSLSSPI